MFGEAHRAIAGDELTGQLRSGSISCETVVVEGCGNVRQLPSSSKRRRAALAIDAVEFSFVG